jgi:ADP-dependent phosphofructokinase/glucokinase
MDAKIERKSKKSLKANTVAVSASALLGCIERLREALATCEMQESSDDLYEFVASALEDHGIPKLECVAEEDEYRYVVGPLLALKKEGRK